MGLSEREGGNEVRGRGYEVGSVLYYIHLSAYIYPTLTRHEKSSDMSCVHESFISK